MDTTRIIYTHVNLKVVDHRFRNNLQLIGYSRLIVFAFDFLIFVKEKNHKDASQANKETKILKEYFYSLKTRLLKLFLYKTQLFLIFDLICMILFLNF